MRRLLGFLIVLLLILLVLTDTGLITNNFFDQESVPTKNAGFKLQVLDEDSARIKAIQKALPSVVTVSATTVQVRPGVLEFDPGNPFSPFRRRSGEEREVEANIGSGFAIEKNLIITNRHVVSDHEAKYKIITQDGRELAVSKISRDPLNDLAILQVNGADMPTLTLADSDSLKLGSTVIAIGTPLGEFAGSVTTGIVSGLGRGVTAGSPFAGAVEQLDNVIQTDAAINPGNSGGPLINLAGEVVGVNTAVSQGSENIGFAIPSKVVADLLTNFDRRAFAINRPLLGIRYHLLEKAEAKENDLPEGALIIEVIENSGADKAGVRKGDVLTEFDGSKISSDSKPKLNEQIAKKKFGDKVVVKLWRDGEELTKTVTLGLFE